MYVSFDSIVAPWFVGWLVVTVAWYTMDDSWHFPSNGQLFLFRQLQLLLSSGFFSCDLLCWSIFVLTFGMQLYESLSVFLLNIGFNLWPSGKLSSIIVMNLFPTLVFTCMSKGGLNHVMFLFRFLFCWFLLLGVVGLNFISYLYPLFFNDS